uniref:Uncharacterized protein n=1 Tax=Sphaerodactylus townsendi TaxID=933632 RepID=A0ACB8END8_9SAUR
MPGTEHCQCEADALPLGCQCEADALPLFIKATSMTSQQLHFCFPDKVKAPGIPTQGKVAGGHKVFFSDKRQRRKTVICQAGQMRIGSCIGLKKQKKFESSGTF